MDIGEQRSPADHTIHTLKGNEYMICSMTGFASGQCACPQGVLSLELRSINHRFLDITVRVPEECRSLEGRIREKIAEKCLRGKIECRMSLSLQGKGEKIALELNRPLLVNVLQLAAQVEAILPEAETLRVGEILNWPGMLVTKTILGEEVEPIALELLDQLLAEWIESRAREGEKLALSMLERISQMEALVTELRPALSRILGDHEARLRLRLVQALGSVDDERLRQELVFFAQKIDITEELDRLSVHFLELRRIFTVGGSVGKPLDFLMQELNREANTLGSKSISGITSKVAMELKVLIEQIREQVQNLE